MPIMLASKTWSWPNKFMKIILSNYMDETNIIYPEVSSMNW
jgi:hypothetical protein